MQLFFKTRQLARNFKANSTNPDNKQVKDNGTDSAKRWGVVIANNKSKKQEQSGANVVNGHEMYHCEPYFKFL